VPIKLAIVRCDYSTYNIAQYFRFLLNILLVEHSAYVLILDIVLRHR